MLIKEVYSDIEKCRLIIKSKNCKKSDELLNLLSPIYSDYISEIKENVDFYWNYRECNNDKGLEKLALFLRKLEVFYSNGCKSTVGLEKSEASGTKINEFTNNSFTSINNKLVTIQLGIKKTREKLKKDESLAEEEVYEISEKIDEIERIVNLKEPRNIKWIKLRPIFEWLLTKEIDIVDTIEILLKAILYSSN